MADTTTILVLADIHANLEALQAVLEHASKTHGKPDQLWCLGDIVGYGPNPNECIALLRDGHPLIQGTRFCCVQGNHDAGVLAARHRSRADVQGMREVDEGWQWTAQALNTENLDFLAQLPDTYSPPELPQPVLLVHASPATDPLLRLEEYLEVPADIEARIGAFPERFCFFGHTHLACYFVCNTQHKTTQPRLFHRNQKDPIKIPLDERVKVFVNPGTVGQPRWGYIDPTANEYRGDQRVSYVWLTLDATSCTMQCHFVAYDVKKVLAKLNKLNPSNGFTPPQRWKDRLTKGLR